MIQARQLTRYAKKIGMTLKRGKLGYVDDCGQRPGCAVSAFARMHGTSFVFTTLEDVAEYAGYDASRINALELGFECQSRSKFPRAYYELPKASRRYFKVGRNVARLAGLSFQD